MLYPERRVHEREASSMALLLDPAAVRSRRQRGVSKAPAFGVKRSAHIPFLPCNSKIQLSRDVG
jgi:hypothetical protein